MVRYTTYDRQINGGECGRERPDFLWDTGTHAVMLEVDEFQHQRGYKCEIDRMRNITTSIGLPCLWIRYNPDEYKGGGKNLKNVQRRDLLMRVLREAFQSPPSNSDEYCRVRYLCFDGFTSNQDMSSDIIPML